MGRRVLPEDLRKNSTSIRDKAKACKSIESELEIIAESLDVAAYMLELYDQIVVDAD